MAEPSPIQQEIAGLLTEFDVMFEPQMDIAESREVPGVLREPAPFDKTDPTQREAGRFVDTAMAGQPKPDRFYDGWSRVMSRANPAGPGLVTANEAEREAAAKSSRFAFPPKQPSDAPPPWAPVRQQRIDRRLEDPMAGKWLREYARHKSGRGTMADMDRTQFRKDFKQEFDRPPTDHEQRAADDYFNVWRSGRRMLTDQGIDGTAARLAREFPVRRRAELLSAIRDLFNDTRPYEDQPAINKALYALTRGGVRAFENIGDTLGIRHLADNDRAFIDAIRGAAANDPSIGEAPFLERAALQAVEMASQQGVGLGLSAASGPLAPETLTAYWFAQMYPSAYQEMVDAGVPPERARLAAGISAGLQAQVEQLVKNPFKLRGAQRTVKELGLRWAGQVALEDSEEGLQRGLQSLTFDVARGVNPDVGKALIEGLAEMKETLPSLMLMMAPGGVSNATELSRRPGQYADAMERRQARQADLGLRAFQRGEARIDRLAAAGGAGPSGGDAMSLSPVGRDLLGLTEGREAAPAAPKPRPEPVRPTKSALFDDVASWAFEHPEQAAEIATHVNPSQSQVGPIVSGKPLNQRDRRDLAQRLRDLDSQQRLRPITHMNAAEQRRAGLVRQTAEQEGTLPSPAPAGVFFETDGAEIVPIEQLVSLKDEARTRKYKNDGVDPRLTAMRFMHGNQAGQAGAKRRAPLSARKNADGTYTILDGNAAGQAAMLFGQKEVAVRVVDDEGLLDLLRNAKKSRDAKNYLKFYTQRDPAELRRLARRAGVTLPAGSWEQQRDAMLLGTFAAKAESRLQERLAAAPGIKHRYDQVMGEVASALDLEFLAGPIKSAQRAREKVVNDYDADADRLTDLVRGTIALREGRDDQSMATVADVVRQVAEKFPVLKYRNRFDPGGKGPQDLLMVVDVDGERVELQLHVPEVIKAKDVHHKNYKRWRVIDAKMTDGDATLADVREFVSLGREMDTAYAEALAAFMSRTNSSLETGPPSDLSVAIEKGAGSSGSDISKAAVQVPSLAVSSRTGLSPASQNSAPGGKVKSSNLSDAAISGPSSIDNIPQNAAEGEQKVVPPASTPDLKRSDMTPEELDAWLESQIADRLGVKPASSPNESQSKPANAAEGGEKPASRPKKAAGKRAKKPAESRQVAGKRVGDVVQILSDDYKISVITPDYGSGRTLELVAVDPDRVKQRGFGWRSALWRMGEAEFTEYVNRNRQRIAGYGRTDDVVIDGVDYRIDHVEWHESPDMRSLRLIAKNRPPLSAGQARRRKQLTNAVDSARRGVEFKYDLGGGAALAKAEESLKTAESNLQQYEIDERLPGHVLVMSAARFEGKLGRPDVAGMAEPATAPPGAREKKRKKKAARPSKTRKAAVEDRLKGELDDLTKYLDGKAFSGIDPQLIRLTARVIRSYTELGILKFSDAVRRAAADLPRHVDLIAEAFQVGWGALSEIDDRLDPPGDANRVLLEHRINTGGLSAVTEGAEESSDGDGETNQPAAGDALREPGAEPLDAPSADGDAGDGGSGPAADGAGGGAGGSSVPGGAKADGQRGDSPRGGDAQSRPPARPGNRGQSGRARDHRIEPADLERRSFKPKERFADNVAAIRLLKQIETEGRRATAAEQKVLARYVGWGGMPQAFEDATGKWTREIAELRELLTDAEYAAARASTPNAHYTSPAVIRGLWSGIEAAGFSGGHILEPAAGVGHFFGLMPAAIRKGSRLSAVELDSISGRITGQLYQSADVRIDGYQDVKQPDDTFDLTISNVPFANIKITDPHDRGLTRLQASLHDYYFSKALRKTRPGGLVVFLTSRYTLDKGVSKLRKDWADRADFIGAVRLPDTAFKGSSGTEVVTDALIFQRRADGATPQGEAFAKTVKREIDGHDFEVNEYYEAHPENILGEERASGTMYAAAGYNVEAASGLNLEQAIADRIGRMTFDAAALDAVAANSKKARANEKKQAETSDEVDVEAMAEGAVHVDLKQMQLLQKQNGALVPVHIPFVGMGGPGVKGAANRLRRIKDLVGIAPLGRRLIRLQQDPDASEADIADARKLLNEQYDAVVKRWGPINSKTNRTMLSPAYADLPFLMSLEKWDDAAQTARKADIFTKRVQFPVTRIDRADTAQDALGISMAERGGVDIPYMAGLLGKTDAAVIDELAGSAIFKDPATDAWEIADLYLSGNVRRKLDEARKRAAIATEFEANVKALEEVIPEDVAPGQIGVRLGSPWIPTGDYAAFIAEVLSHRADVYLARDGTWTIARADGFGVSAVDTVDFGLPEMPAMKILEKLLNQRPIQVWAGSGDNKVLDGRLTQAAAGKANALKRRFEAWVWEDPERAERLVRSYNDQFNNTVIPTYDGSHLTLPGLTANIQAEMNAGERPYRKAAIWRMMTGGNTLVGHAVGAGKTITAASMCMEMRRLGRWKKPILTVPNHLTSQWPSEFLRAYPDAKILAATEDDFTPRNRQALMNRIATGDWDAVIVPHTSFEKLPLNPDIQAQFFQDEMAALEADIREAKAASGDTRNFVKELEKQLQAFEQKLEKLNAQWRRDPGPYFDELGIDALLVDESQAFKNTFFRTKMTRIPGIAPQHVQRSFDMLMKTRWINNRTNYRGIVFMTGTPVTNSLVEMYALQQYLRPDMLVDRGIEGFDNWANVFGEVVSQAEIAPDGSGVRMHSRFAKFVNLPELTQMYRTYADIVTGEQLGIPRPKIAGGKADIVQAERSPQHKAIVDSLVDRMAAIRSGAVKPDEDNALAVTTDGRKAATDLRLYDPSMPDLPNSKLNQAVERVFKIWQDTAEDRSTQLIWLDQGVPGSEVDLYADIKQKLIARGVPADEIAFIHDAGGKAAKKLALYDKVNAGEVRILIGSTGKMGTGANVQQRLIAAHHLDPPWRPADLEQRDGRIIRFGNTNAEIQLYRYVTQGTFDAYMWQTLETKARFLAQINEGDPSVRQAEDVGQRAFDYAEVKAMAAADPRILDFARLQQEVQQLSAEASQHRETQFRLQREVADSEKEVVRLGDRRKALTPVVAEVADRLEKKEGSGIATGGETFEKPKEAGEWLTQIVTDYAAALTAAYEAGKAPPRLPKPDITVLGYPASLEAKPVEYKNDQATRALHVVIDVNGHKTASSDLGTDPVGNAGRVMHAMRHYAETLQHAEQSIAHHEKRITDGRKRLGTVYPRAEELATKEQELAQLQAALMGDDLDVAAVQRADVIAAFPGASVQQVANGYRVELAGGQFFDITMDPEIEIDNWAKVEKALGREIPPAERAQMVAAGRFEVHTGDRTVNGLGIIRLAAGEATSLDLRHEAVHLARASGLFSDGEWYSLVRRYSDLNADPRKQEEDVAKAAEQWKREPWARRLVAYMRELLDRFGIADIDAASVEVLFNTPGFWRRPTQDAHETGDDQIADPAGELDDAMYSVRRRRPRPMPANPVVDQIARDLVREVDRVWQTVGEPQTRSDDSVVAAAERRLDADYAGERQRLLEVAESGGSLTDVETIIAKAIIEDEAIDAVRSGDGERLMDAKALIDAYRRTGTEAARAFRQRRDPVGTPSQRRARVIVENLMAPPESVQRQIDAARGVDPAAVRRLQAQWFQRISELKVKLRRMGIDLDQIEALAADEVASLRAVKAISALKASGWDKLYEYWQNAILSAPTTHVANITGNFFNAGWDLTAQRFVEAMVNLGVRDEKGASFGEFRHMLAGVLPGIARGARNFLRTWTTETAYFEREILGTAAGSGKLDTRQPAIGGRLGGVVRSFGYRPLLAVDEFFKSVIGEVEAGAHAHRLARAAGLSGPALRRRVAALVADMDSEAWQLALGRAKDLTFQRELGLPGKAVLKVRKDVPFVRWIMPFVTTPANIFKTGLRKTPLNTPVVIAKAIRNRSFEGLTPEIAEQMISWAVVLALLSVIDDDDDKPRITGTRDELSYAKRTTARRVLPAQSIRIGDTWYSYARIEPFATTIGVTVDWLRALRSGDSQEMAAAPFDSLVGQVKNKSFLSGVGDMLRALEGEHSQERLARWASGFTTSFVPNVAKSASRSADDEYAERGVWGEGMDWWTRLGRRTLQRTELSGLTEEPSIDLWGRPASRSRSPVFDGPVTDWLYQFVVPIRNQEARLLDADRMLVTWNLANPREAWHPVAPGKTWRDADGSERSMTDRQYAEYSQLAGRTAALLAGFELGDPAAPDKAAIERLSANVAAARSMAKEALVKQWEGEAEPIDTARTLAEQIHERHLVQAAGALSRAKPLAVAKRKGWEMDRQRAKAWVETTGVDRTPLIEAYKRELRKTMRDPKAIMYRVARLRRSLPAE